MKINDVVIIGSGPAGLTCSIYLSRANIKHVLIAGDNPGGQLVNTSIIENFPGIGEIQGSELVMKMIKQAEKFGAEFIYDKVKNVNKTDNNFFEINLASGELLLTKSVLISTGARHKTLEVAGESKFTNKGVSWCATCDGPMFKNKTVAVIGGGNTAVMEALFLANFVNKVILIHRRDMLRAEKFMQDKLFTNPKINYLWNSEIVKINGSQTVTSIDIMNRIDESVSNILVDAVFVAIGTKPSSEFITQTVAVDEEGYIIAPDTKTSCNGIFAAGDVVQNSLKQAIFAAGQGCLASKKILEYLGIF